MKIYVICHDYTYNGFQILGVAESIQGAIDKCYIYLENFLNSDCKKIDIDLSKNGTYWEVLKISNYEKVYIEEFDLNANLNV